MQHEAVPKVRGYAYSGSDDLNQVGWYIKNSGGETKPVGLLLPNELGLYDMSGNVREWCEDDWHGNYNGAPKYSRAWIDSPKRTTNRVVRGGFHFTYAVYCRAANRDHAHADYSNGNIGFRLVFAPRE